MCAMNLAKTAFPQHEMKCISARLTIICQVINLNLILRVTSFEKIEFSVPKQLLCHHSGSTVLLLLSVGTWLSCSYLSSTLVSV